MKLKNHLLKKAKDQRGAAAIMVAIAVAFFLIGFAALAIDVGYLFASKNELQNAADSAALAGAGLLGQIYANMSYTEQQGYNCTQDTWPDGYGSDEDSIRHQAQDAINSAGGKDITIDANDIYINTWTGTPFNTNYTVQPDAVRVIARRDSSAKSAEGPITTFFAKIFGMDTANVNAVATAALTGPAKVDEGEMNLPIGLSEWQFFNNCDKGNPRGQPVCSESITFSPTTDSCAGWHNFFDPINADAMEEKLLGFIKGNPLEGEDCLDFPCGQNWLDQHFDMNKDPDAAVTPVTTAGGSAYFFQGGTISSLFNGGWLMWNDADGKRVDPMIDPSTGRQMVDGNEKKPAPFPALFDYFRFRDGDADPPGEDADGDGEYGESNDEVWTATAPIYEDNCPCDNPNTELTIIGFTRVVVRMPNPPPDSTVTATVSCEWTAIEARGGGGTFGNLKGTIPNLVE
jgi:hypothetical protein